MLLVYNVGDTGCEPIHRVFQAPKGNIITSDKITVLLADDHRLVRAAVCKLLQKEHDFSIVGEADDGQQTLALLEKVAAKVLVLDVNMPHVDGLEVLKRLRERQNRPRVIVLSMHSDPDLVDKARKLGASGYVRKGDSATTLIKAVKVVAGGGTFFNDDLLRGGARPSRHAG